MSSIAAGAFDSSGTLLGFVFGLTGWMDGELCHWSHMLAVAEPYRDRGIGRDLKVFQRSVLESQHVVALYWSYDPLVARNAHLNLSKLGAHVTEYVPDMYGVDPGSVTDRIIGSDRFVVRWPLQAGRRADGQTGASELDPPAVLRCDESQGQAPVVEPKTGDSTVRVEIPHDIQSLKTVAPDVAREWRAATRKVFQSYLETGYRVVDFKRREDAGSSYYVLTRDASAGSAA
jgi:predicted GNAT superfamily acetyltransferase